MNQRTAIPHNEMAKYQITIQGNPRQEWHSRIADLSGGIELADSHHKVVTVDLRSEAALMQLLNEIHSQGIELVSLRRLPQGAQSTANRTLSAVQSH